MSQKKILLCGEAWGEREEREGRPFVGPSGALLDAFLSSQGIARRDCYVTNVLNFRPPYNKLLSLCGPKAQGIPGMPVLQKNKYLSAAYKPELDRLYSEVRNVDPNLIVALGGTACWALLKNGSIKKLRGAPTMSITGHKVLPTYHPAAVMREFKLRPIVFSDFKKIARECEYREIRRPARDIWIRPTLEDIHAFEPFILESEFLSLDIETRDRQITCIGFGPSIDRVIVIPFHSNAQRSGNYWPTLKEELEVWKIVRKWCGLGKKVIGQNIIYDCSYLWKIYGIPVLHVWDDTMLLQHAAQPEMEKSLRVLGSLYTDEPPWKFMNKTKTIKKED